MPAAVSWPIEHLSQAERCYISLSALNSCHDVDQRKLLLLKPEETDGLFCTLRLTIPLYLLNLSVYGLSRLIFLYLQIRDVGPHTLSYATSTEDSGNKERTLPCRERVT
jgi:hypothetical protein